MSPSVTLLQLMLFCLLESTVLMDEMWMPSLAVQGALEVVAAAVVELAEGVDVVAEVVSPAEQQRYLLGVYRMMQMKTT